MMITRIPARYLIFRLFLFCILPWSSSLGETFTAKVVGISDGDTITVLHNQNEIKIRLHGIDCPESGEEFSNKAKRFTSALVFGKTVRLQTIEQDRYGRTVARVFVDDLDVSVELVRAGMAWHYVKYAPDDDELARAQKIAQAAGIGVWSLPNPLPPWQKVEVENRIRATPSGVTYHGNRKSHVFHSPSCRYYTCKNCTQVFSSREEAISAGYRPCGICKP